jgi:hypothetical protein
LQEAVVLVVQQETAGTLVVEVLVVCLLEDLQLQLLHIQ